MDDLQKRNATQRVVDWITLSLSIVFVVIGLGILTGLILGDRVFFQGHIRAIAGLVLVGYGIVRGSMMVRRLRS